MTMRILWIPMAHSADAASSRLRCFRPAGLLASNGIHSDIHNAEVPADPPVADVVIFQKAYGEREIALAERFRAAGTPVVFDLCDNHFLASADHPYTLERAERLHRILAATDVVTCSSPALMEVVRRHHPRCQLVEDPLESAGRTGLPLAVKHKWFSWNGFRPLRVVWFGNAGSEFPRFGLADLLDLIPSLERLAASVPLTLTVVSNSPERFEKGFQRSSLMARYVPWNRESIFRILRQQHVCIIPISANEFTLCKTANRVVTALQSGLAVVAQPIPSYEEFRPFCWIGDVVEGIEAFAADPAQAYRRTREGLRFARRRFDDRLIRDQWQSAIRSALGRA